MAEKLHGTMWCFLVLAVTAFQVQAKIRWSANHLIPDADMLHSGDIALSLDGLRFVDDSTPNAVKINAGLRAGIGEWVTVHAGFAGGASLGFKARLISDRGRFVPSIAVGAHNIIQHKEIHLFDYQPPDSTLAYNNEYFIALGKNIEGLKTRLHAGLQTMPNVPGEQLNYFAGVEKYFGAGMYTTLEMHSRDSAFHSSLFLSWRLFRRSLEFSTGFVGLNYMLFNDFGEFRFSMTGNHQRIVKPGIWFALRWRGNIGFGSVDGIKSTADRVRRQENEIKDLRMQIDSLRMQIGSSRDTVLGIKKSLSDLADSVSAGNKKLRLMILDKIIALNNTYTAEHFDPEQAKRLISEIRSFREKALPGLKDIVSDKTEDRRIRMIAIAMIGEIGNTAASDILLDVLGQTSDPDVKIETLIALGKMKETRASYVMEQLANDPNDAVAYTAQEVLEKLRRETGIRLSDDFAPRAVTFADSGDIPDQKISTGAGRAARPESIVDEEFAAQDEEAVIEEEAVGEDEETDIAATFSEQDTGDTTGADTTVSGDEVADSTTGAETDSAGTRAESVTVDSVSSETPDTGAETPAVPDSLSTGEEAPSSDQESQEPRPEKEKAKNKPKARKKPAINPDEW